MTKYYEAGEEVINDALNELHADIGVTAMWMIGTRYKLAHMVYSFRKVTYSVVVKRLDGADLRAFTILLQLAHLEVWLLSLLIFSSTVFLSLVVKSIQYPSKKKICSVRDILYEFLWPSFGESKYLEYSPPRPPPP